MVATAIKLVVGDANAERLVTEAEKAMSNTRGRREHEASYDDMRERSWWGSYEISRSIGD